ncbi:hypothetical protein [Aureimonas leprariae]|uniref:Uncharacterized protein n=1 Tax=Plantimonas leprariae TaxID=2615207 RepID=A0A7V7PPU7_9HYPH|nr:hypothetical protein [Aureimonas leprariae]KAB0680077.1 hypothetical protein F6X38_09715 [Aureimonas leprariae]
MPAITNNSQQQPATANAPDLDRIKRNVAKMVDMGAPEGDIDLYIAEEGVTLDAVKAHKLPSVSSAPATAGGRPQIIDVPGMGEVEFPAGMSDAEMSAAVRRSMSQQQPQPQAVGGYRGDVNGTGGSTLLGALDGMSFGFADEIGAGISAGVDTGLNYLTGRQGKTYEQHLTKLRGLQANAQENHPVANFAGQVGGSLALPGGAAKTLKGAVGQGIAAGAAYGAGSADGTAEDRVLGAVFGGGAGAAGSVAARTIGNAVARAGARRAIPTTEALEDASHALYDAADAASVVFQPKTVNKMVGNAKLAAGRLDTNIRPRTAGVVAEFEDKAGRPIGLREFDDLRKTVTLSMDGASKEDGRTLTIIKRQLDHLADNLTASDVGGSIEGVGHLKEARRLWSMKAKSEDIGQMVERARTTAAGNGSFENALRSEFKALAKNADKLKRFSSAEQSAILGVARGGLVVNSLRVLGKFSPDSPFLALLGSGAALGASGGIAAVGVPLAGMGAKTAATAMTRGRVRALDEVIRSGGQTVGDIVRQGRLGQGIGAPAAARGQAITDRALLPLALTAAELEAMRR